METTLGNIRLSYSDADGNGSINTSTEIIEEKNYYPFGLSHRGYNNIVSANSNSVASKFGFGGKELNDELGLDWYDVSARNYDPALGRWMNLDPLAEKMKRHSPYNYAFDNPIRFIDPDGMAPLWEPLGNGMWKAEAGDSAWTLHQQAGISFDKAKEIMANTQKLHSEGGNMGTYKDTDGVIKSKVDKGDIVTVPSQYKEYLSNVTKKANQLEIDKIMNEGIEAAMEKIDENIADTDTNIENLERKNDSLEGVNNGDSHLTMEEEVIKIITKKRAPGKYGQGIQALHEAEKMMKDVKKRKKIINKNKNKIDSMKRENENRKKIKENNNG